MKAYKVALNSETFRIGKIPNFMSGFRSIVKSDEYEYKATRDGAEIDREALESDWRVASKDVTDAYKIMKKENRSCKKGC